MQYRNPLIILVGIIVTVLIWLAAIQQFYAAHNRSLNGYILTLIGIVLLIYTLRPVPVTPQDADTDASETEEPSALDTLIPRIRRYLPIIIGILLSSGVIIGIVTMVNDFSISSDIVLAAMLLALLGIIVQLLWSKAP